MVDYGMKAQTIKVNVRKPYDEAKVRRQALGIIAGAVLLILAGWLVLLCVLLAG